MPNSRDDRNNQLVVENARIMFRNFSGAAGQYNRPGDRNFCMVADPDSAQWLEKNGWNVKYLKPRDEDDEPVPYIKVTVRFDRRPPKIVLITGQGKTVLNEEALAVLDFAEIENVDLILSGYRWDVNESTGVKAYLKTAYITLVTDEFESKYYDVPDSAMGSVTVAEVDDYV